MSLPPSTRSRSERKASHSPSGDQVGAVSAAGLLVRFSIWVRLGPVVSSRISGTPQISASKATTPWYSEPASTRGWGVGVGGTWVGISRAGEKGVARQYAERKN